MEFGQLFSSLNTLAVIALVITVLVLLFELRHLFFRKKVISDPQIPDFDDSTHAAPEHATPLDVKPVEERSGINVLLVIILIGIIVVLLVVVLGGFLVSKKKETFPPPIPTSGVSQPVVEPTSPFEPPVEVPFDLSGTPTFLSITPSPAVTLQTTSVQITSTLTLTPTLPESGNYHIFFFLTIIPIVVLLVALIL